MGRLSTIEDLEQRTEREAQAAQRQEQPPAPRQQEAAAPQQAQQDAHPAEPKSQAQLEAEFHGLDTAHKRDGGHTALIVAAVLIVAAAAVYIANYSLHFF
ncbi:MAG: hypothetical protein ACI36W_02150 [Coriobacteriales bacterium]